ncbi:ABC transporter aclQ [Penicillium sp. IBT 18751x]|nr:ABC transporter aclQ [Penicillium sp. IBT 18751x]
MESEVQTANEEGLESGGKHKHFDRYRDILEDHLAIQSVTKHRGVVQILLQNSVLIGLFVFICCIALYQVSIGMRPIGAFVQVIAYVSQLLAPLSFFARLYDSFQTAVINAERTFEILQTEPAVAAGAAKLRAYASVESTLVGKSGSGKSTIFDLICGFHEFEGQITIDGYDIREFDIRKHIAVVSQDTPLFNQPIMYNLTCGTTGATEDEVREACRNSAILEHIDRVPGGYKAMAGPRGTNLSGGEKQRIALARLFLMESRRIRLVGEGTSALDTTNEQHVEESLMKTGSDYTTLVITHRLRSIIEADEIIVLDDGEIVESGTHAELLKLGRIYAAKWAAERAPYL